MSKKTLAIEACIKASHDGEEHLIKNALAWACMKNMCSRLVGAGLFLLAWTQIAYLAISKFLHSFVSPHISFSVARLKNAEPCCRVMDRWFCQGKYRISKLDDEEKF
ncbi:putative amino acid permease 7-like protein [Corchorus olitorius]|uniref:Amino acid permease 7-like protein n=1 Tax=Corchorus olitorius TaxID=93759 RepID=A0A1R3HAY0_9ROSI|nr:putative amino acid permease 7-like protein [Corchorus olitorius]